MCFVPRDDNKSDVKLAIKVYWSVKALPSPVSKEGGHRVRQHDLLNSGPFLLDLKITNCI